MSGALVVVREPTKSDNLAAITSDPQTLEVVGQRVMDGWSLKQIARSWEVPVIAFITWLMADPDRKAAYEAALRVRADELALQTVELADNGAGDVQRAALGVKTRFQLATFLDRERFGDKRALAQKQRVLVDRTCTDGTRETIAVESGGD